MWRTSGTLSVRSRGWPADAARVARPEFVDSAGDRKLAHKTIAEKSSPYQINVAASRRRIGTYRSVWLTLLPIY